MFRFERVEPLLPLVQADVNAATLVVACRRIAIDGSIKRIGLVSFRDAWFADDLLIDLTS